MFNRASEMLNSQDVYQDVHTFYFKGEGHIKKNKTNRNNRLRSRDEIYIKCLISIRVVGFMNEEDEKLR